MKDTKKAPAHTAGPWTQSEISPESVWGTIDGMNVCIAVCKPKAFGVSMQQEWEENARLIAAAPSILQDLQTTQDDLNTIIDNISCGQWTAEQVKLHCMDIQARNAETISKATAA